MNSTFDHEEPIEHTVEVELFYKEHKKKTENKLPKSVISDRGPQFVVELMKELNKILGIEIKLSIAFHL